jgi:hypothetical protein
MSDRQPLPLAERTLIVAQNEPQVPLAAATRDDLRLENQSVAQIRAEDAVASHGMPSEAPTPDPEMDEVNQYLWGVYQRSAVKRDGSGDFTWKDVAAAARLGMTLGDYVIVGMDRDFRELLYRAGWTMDAAGIRWTILSAFRDDYRQSLASGYKAHIGASLHGGSITTGGYGHGCAVDIADADGNPQFLRNWLDANSGLLNLERPLPGIDPAHVQARGAWHEVAAALRKERLAKGNLSENAAAAAELASLATAPASEVDRLCTGLHHYHPDPIQAVVPPAPKISKAVVRIQHLPAGESKPVSKTAPRAAEAGRLLPHAKGGVRSPSRHAGHAVARNGGAT